MGVPDGCELEPWEPTGVTTVGASSLGLVMFATLAVDGDTVANRTGVASPVQRLKRWSRNTAMAAGMVRNPMLPMIAPTSR